MYILIILSLVGIACARVNKEEIIEDEGWQIWKGGHNKKYSDFVEEKMRFGIWKDNFHHIVEYNEKSSNLFLAMNHFGDMTNTEFRAIMNGYFYRYDKNIPGSKFLSPSHLVLPDEVDWRTKKGWVSEVKDQGKCGSCWAFSTTGSLEGQHARKTGKAIDLSEQNLIDCSTKYGNHGCQGGLMDYAFKYIRENGGIDTEQSYPYEGVEGDCRFNASAIGADVTSYVDIQPGDEQALQNASASVGPISIAVDASHFTFQFYHTGVYDEPECSSSQLDHGMLLVGYGVLPKDKGNTKYWIVKNSWTKKWGKDGYVYMSRDKGNQCGVATAASFPLV